MRQFDQWLLNRVGVSALPGIWMRSFLKQSFSKKIDYLSPTVYHREDYESLLAQPSIDFLRLFISTKPNLPRSYNGCNFNGLDLLVYDSILERVKPKRIIEVGCGGSTQYAAFKGSSWSVDITCIDPEPRTVLPSSIRYLCDFVQNIKLEQFDYLQPGDILFIDSSHLTEEARYHTENILPRLKSGVIIHYHDIYYPFDIHPEWGEQDVILDFLNHHRNEYRTIVSNPYMYYYNQYFFRAMVSFLSKLPPWNVGGSLWFEKV